MGLPPDTGMACYRCHLPPGRIAFCRFILEGYDGLATLSTESAVHGLVWCRSPASQAVVLGGLLADWCCQGIIYSFLEDATRISRGK